MEFNLNLRHLLIVSLGYNDYLHAEIDKLYEQKRWTYYEIFKNGGFYDDMVIKSFTTVKEEKMRKVAGMVDWCYKHNDFSLIHHLIKKGYKDAQRYYQQNRNRLNLQDFSLFILKKKGVSTTEMPELELAMHHIVLIYLANNDGNNVGEIFESSYAEVALSILQGISDDLLHSYFILHKIKEDNDLFQQTVAFIQECIGLDITKKIPDTLDKIFDFVIDSEHAKELAKLGFTVNNVPMEIAQDIRSSLFGIGVCSLIGGYSAALKITELNHLDFLNIGLTKDEILTIAYTSLQRREQKLCNKDESVHHFIASLYIYAATKQYKAQKETLLQDTYESWYIDAQKREEEMLTREKKFELQTVKAEKAYESEKSKLQAAQDKIKEMEKELKRLRGEAKEFEEDKEELAELRTFAYSQQQQDIEYDEPTIIHASEVLQKKKVIICGGHPNMHRRLKEWVPNLETMTTDTLNKNLNYLKGYDVVFFYPNYSNHSFYKKIKAAIKNSKTAFEYLPDIDNADALLVTMHKHFEPNANRTMKSNT